MDSKRPDRNNQAVLPFTGKKKTVWIPKPKKRRQRSFATAQFCRAAQRMRRNWLRRYARQQAKKGLASFYRHTWDRSPISGKRELISIPTDVRRWQALAR